MVEGRGGEMEIPFGPRAALTTQAPSLPPPSLEHMNAPREHKVGPGASSIRHCVAVYGEGVVAKENKMLEELLFQHFWCLMRL